MMAGAGGGENREAQDNAAGEHRGGDGGGPVTAGQEQVDREQGRGELECRGQPDRGPLDR